MTCFFCGQPKEAHSKGERVWHEGNPVQTFFSLSCKVAWLKNQRPTKVENPYAIGKQGDKKPRRRPA